MKHWATQLPPWFWILVGVVVGYWAAYLIVALTNMAARAATHVTIRQHGGIAMITGIVKGGTGKFQATFNGALDPTAPIVWAADPLSIVIAPSGDGLTCDAIIVASEPLASFSLSVHASASDHVTVSTSVSVPLLEPPPAPATAVVIDQIA